VSVAELDFEQCYRAIESRDPRFDGWFIVGVHTTRIYCRPSCPAPVCPKRRNVSFYRTAAAAQLAGLRACKRCRPDAIPGSPEWDARADLVGRAMRLIADGLVDRAGVGGLARRLAVSERHLHRLLVEQVGAPPLALARSQRAQTARVLIETTSLPFAGIAFASGFSSVRQFNDTIRQVFASSPTDLRRMHRRGDRETSGRLTLRLAVRQPYDRDGVVRWLAAGAV
jgi:AraC family transcriptional regulator, regulatory protein of adaptative response / DNA-3-methyladenine glycosylase II